MVVGIKWLLALEKDRVELDQDAECIDKDEKRRLRKRYIYTCYFVTSLPCYFRLASVEGMIAGFY